MPHFHRPPHHRDSSDDSSQEKVTNQLNPADHHDSSIQQCLIIQVTPPAPPPVCCELPDLMNALNEPEIFGKCHRFVHEQLNPGGKRSHHRHGSFKPASKTGRVARDVEESKKNELN